MGFLSRFDINSASTQFFMIGMVLLLVFTILLTIVAPKKRRSRRGSRVDDRYEKSGDELID